MKIKIDVFMGDDLYTAEIEGTRDSVFESAAESLGKLERKCQKMEEFEQIELNSQEVPL